MYLDVRGWLMHPDLFQAVRDLNLPVRLSTKYWAEKMGRPYQPLETFARFSSMHFLENARPYDFYWEIWALGSHRLLLWGDPECVRRAAGTFSLGDGSGGLLPDLPRRPVHPVQQCGAPLRADPP